MEENKFHDFQIQSLPFFPISFVKLQANFMHHNPQNSALYILFSAVPQRHRLAQKFYCSLRNPLDVKGFAKGMM